MNKPSKLDLFLAQAACEVFNRAADWDMKSIKEAVEETKEVMSEVYAKAYDDGFSVGFEEGVKQDLGL